MKAYCINLDRRPDRLAHMTAQFEAMGQSFERVSAIDANTPEIADAVRRCGVSVTGLKMGAGAHACFQSHRKAWRLLLETGDSHAMVLEDDVVLAPGFAACLAPGWVPEDADLVRLETFLTRFHRDRGPGIAAAGRRLYRLRSRHAGAGCYVISAVAAERLLGATDPIDDPIDELLFNEAAASFGERVVYQMIPSPAVQGDRLMPGKVKADTGWQATSIIARHAEDSTAEMAGPEGAAGRLVRRLQEEMRALRQGTRYVVAPHG
jgi:glycosyl transferase family 25